MNWGQGIAILTIGFVVFMSALVFKAVNQDFDLVADDYYDKEIAFQQQIEKQKNHLAEGADIKIVNEDENVVLNFEELNVDAVVSGKVTFYYATGSSKDLTADLSLKSGQQVFSKKQLSTGKCTVKIDYAMNGKLFYYEQVVFI